MIIFIKAIFLFTLSASNLGFVGGTLLVMAFIAFRFFRITVNDLRRRNNDLLKQMEDLHTYVELLTEKEAKARNEIDRIDKAKGKLLSSMSHEIRTPMNGIIGMTSLLAETNLTEDQHEYTDTILVCSKTLLTKVNEILINDILEFSKVDANNNALEYKKFDLRNCIEEVLEMFSSKAAETKLDLVYQMDEEVPLQVIGDAKRLRQVLVNLVENAFKFTKEGEIFVGVHLFNKDTDKLKIGFEVNNSGEGIPADMTEKIFIPVLPSDYSTKNKEAGAAGLGLVICKKLVESMGGQIKAERMKEKGTSFIFFIETKPLEEAQLLGKLNMMGFEGENILIVDDNATARNVLRHQMEQWKLLPVAADSGLQALESLSQVSFDLVVIDLDMPGMDGMELGQSIKKQYPKIPLVLLNPLNNERYKQCDDVFNSVITKPIKQHVLFDTIVSELRNKNSVSASGQKAAHKISTEFSTLYPLKILIAEDNPINQKWITKILNKLGYGYKIGNNGKEVLDIVSYEHYDLILMDVQMPEMDGLEATKMIRLCLETQPVIIAMTANVMQGDREECMQAGMNDYISKPVDLGQLVSMLEKWALHVKENPRVIV